MAMSFVGGVMNLLWIAAIAVFVLAKKLVPSSRRLPRAAGALLAGCRYSFSAALSATPINVAMA